ncbi:hypothetical protein AB205_0118440, partial [Aquarana catesbeiana]
LYYDRGNHHEFVSLVKDLARPGELSQSQSFDFEFTHVEKPYESYTGESIPIRLFLAGYELTPTMRDINKKFSVRYYLNLVLIDEEERRYFKQQEVVLWRKGDVVRKSMSHQAAIASQRFEGTHPDNRPQHSGAAAGDQEIE